MTSTGKTWFPLAFQKKNPQEIDGIDVIPDAPPAGLAWSSQDLRQRSGLYLKTNDDRLFTD